MGIFILLFIIIQGTTCYGQQPSNITNYMFTGLVINPAFAGGGDAICATGLYRQQWMALKDVNGDKVAPETFFITVDGTVRAIHGGVGAVLIQDKIKGFTNMDLKINYAYITDLGQGVLSAAAQLDIVNIKKDGDYNPIIKEDETIKGDVKSDLGIDAGIGVIYRVPDKYHIGLSVDRLLGSELSKLHFNLKRTFYLHGGYNWQVPGKPAFEIQPSALIRTDLGAFSADVTALVLYQKKYWGGLSYRYGDMIALLGGLSIKGVKVGFSYDLGLSKLSHYHSGTIEVLLNYCFKIKTDKYRKSYRNTRFL